MENLPLDKMPYEVISILRGTNRFFRDNASDEMLGRDRMAEITAYIKSLDSEEAASRLEQLSSDDKWDMLCYLSGNDMLFPSLRRVHVRVDAELSAGNGAVSKVAWDMNYPDAFFLLKDDKKTGASLSELYDRLHASIVDLLDDRLCSPSFTRVWCEWQIDGLMFITADPVTRQLFLSTATSLSSYDDEDEDENGDLVFIRVEGNVDDVVVRLVMRLLNIWH